MENQETTLVLKEQPQEIVAFGQNAATQLVGLVKSNNWSVNIQGNDYLRFEAWQTVGRFFGYTIKTKSTEYVEYGSVKGFNAIAEVLDRNGQVVGGAESTCLSDEKQWTNKPLYALKSMAQTRAAGRALRQVLSWVVVLAGYKPTPVEEMTDLKLDPSKAPQPRAKVNPYTGICSQCQAEISQKVSSYSKGKYNVELCYNCQKQAESIDPEEVELTSEILTQADKDFEEAQEVFSKP